MNVLTCQDAQRFTELIKLLRLEPGSLDGKRLPFVIEAASLANMLYQDIGIDFTGMVTMISEDAYGHSTNNN